VQKSLARKRRDGCIVLGSTGNSVYVAVFCILPRVCAQFLSTIDWLSRV